MKNDEISSGQLLSIGDIAKSIHITRRMILNYEDRGLVSPDKKEGETGYRYYTVDTLSRIRTIRILQDLGLSLDEIHSYFSDSTELGPLIKRLESMRDELNLSIEKLRARLDSGGSFGVEYSSLPRQTVYCKKVCCHSVEEKKACLRTVFFDAMREYCSDTSKRMFFIEYPFSAPEEVSFCVSVPEGSRGEFISELPELPSLCITFHGGYEKLPGVLRELRAFAEKEGIELRGTCRHIYLEGPPQHKDENKFITQVAVPIFDRRLGKEKSSAD